MSELRTATALVAVAARLALPASSPAQERELPRAAQQVAVASLNGLIGGTIAGLSRVIRGGSFTDAFLPGAIGGAVAFAGRRLTVERFDGAGLLAREISAVGASMVRNAGEGIGPLERVQLPLGPLELVVLPRRAGSVRARLQLFDAVRIVSAFTQPELDFDGWASLSSGAAVFRAPGRALYGDEGHLADGLAEGGVIYLADKTASREATVIGHERVHILQFDFLNITVGDPLEASAARLSGPTRRVHRLIGTNYLMTIMRGSLEGVGIDWIRDVDESEAYWLAGG